MAEAASAADEGEINLIRWSTSYPRRFELILKGLAFEKLSHQINVVFEETDGEDI